LQGERPMADDNKTLGRFMLDGIPPAPRGVPQVEVKFDIDANGILNVSAKDKATSKSQSIRIEGSSGLKEEEIEKMKTEAKTHEEEDKKKRESIEVKNTANAMVYQTEKTLKDLKVEEAQKKEIEAKIEELKKVKDSDNIEDIKKKTEELSSAIQKISQEAYQKQQEKKEPKEPEEGEVKEK